MTFWREKTLQQMTEGEWKSLCDGCGLCCQTRVKDEDTGEIALSDVACRYLDLGTHRCGDTEEVHRSGPSMRGDLVSEDDVEWPD